MKTSMNLKVASATFGSITMFKEQSLSFHGVYIYYKQKIAFLSFPTTSFALLVFIARHAHFQTRDDRGKHTFEK